MATDGQGRTVAIVLTPHESYAAVAGVVEKQLTEAGYACVRIDLPKDAGEAASDGPAKEPTTTADEPPKAASAELERAVEKLIAAKPRAVVSVGLMATTAAMRAIPDKPVVFAMVANALDTPVMAGDRPGGGPTGVAAEISPADQVDWIKETAGARNVAVFHSSASRKTAEAIAKAGSQKGVTIIPIETRKDDFAKAIEQLARNKADGALMIPDARVYNVANVRALLLWGIRQKKPVWGFSASVVKAGALAGRYSNGEEVGRRAAELIKKVMAAAPPEEFGLQYPAAAESAVNVRTAELIGVSLKPEILKKATVRFGKDE